MVSQTSEKHRLEGSVAESNPKRLRPSLSRPSTKKFASNVGSLDTPAGLELVKDEDSESNFSDTKPDFDDLDVSVTSDTPITPQTPASSNGYFRELKYFCRYEGCDRVYDRPIRLEQHVRSQHTGERPHKCPYESCDKAYPRKDRLNHHIREKHTLDKHFVCTWGDCQREFTTGQRLRRHMESHENKLKYTCEQCDKAFRKQHTLDAHVLSDHCNQYAYPCTHADETTGQPCQKGYDTKQKLVNHVTRTHDRGPTHTCSQCSVPNPEYNDASSAEVPPTIPLSFYTYAQLREHYKEAHPPICTECGMTCSSQAQLKFHLELAHSGVPLSARKTILCPYPGCKHAVEGEGFTRQGNLNTHVRTVHEKKKQFVCGENKLITSKDEEVKKWWANGMPGACGFGAGQKANLEEHIRTQHLGLLSLRKRKPPANQYTKGRQLDHEEATPHSRRRPHKHFTGRIKNPPLNAKNITRALTGVGDHIPGFDGPPPVLDTVNAGENSEVGDIVIDPAILEQNANEGGQFWIGGGEMVHGRALRLAQEAAAAAEAGEVEGSGEGFAVGVSNRVFSFGMNFDEFHRSSMDQDEGMEALRAFVNDDEI